MSSSHCSREACFEACHITLVITGEAGTLIVLSEEEEPVGYGVPLGPSKPDWQGASIGLEAEGRELHRGRELASLSALLGVSMALPLLFPAKHFGNGGGVSPYSL